MSGFGYHDVAADWWPYAFILLAGWLPTDVWRWIGVASAGRVDESSRLISLARAVATALVAAVIARLVFYPTGFLASVPGALSPIYRASWMRHLPGGDPGNNYLLPWELEDLLHEQGWRIVDGWGDWGEDLYGVANDAASLQPTNRRLQQATATAWTTIAA